MERQTTEWINSGHTKVKQAIISLRYDNLNAKKYDFIFIDESTLEVRCKVMDETYSNLIDEIHSHYSFSKDGIVCIEEDVSK